MCQTESSECSCAICTSLGSTKFVHSHFANPMVHAINRRLPVNLHGYARPRIKSVFMRVRAQLRSMADFMGCHTPL